MTESSRSRSQRLELWTCIREYIAAEVTLCQARRDRDVIDGNPYGGSSKAPSLEHYDKKISALEEQSTRMDTEIRRLLEAL
jgi:hypothetical protein